MGCSHYKQEEGRWRRSRRRDEKIFLLQEEGVARGEGRMSMRTRGVLSARVRMRVRMLATMQMCTASRILVRIGILKLQTRTMPSGMTMTLSSIAVGSMTTRMTKEMKTNT